MDKMKKGAIVAIVIIALAVSVVAVNSQFCRTSGNEYLVKSDFSDLGEDSRVYFEKYQDKLLIPIDMDKTGTVCYYVESVVRGKAVLEKQIGENEWEEVKSSGKRRQCYGLRVSVEPGIYRIKAGPYKDSVYIEYSTHYRDEPATDKEHAELRKLNRIGSNEFSLNETDSHWYKFAVKEKAERVISIFSGMNWSEFEFKVKLYDEEGNLLCEETLLDDLNPNENPEKEIKREFEPGTYYLEFSKVKEESQGEYGFAYNAVD